MEKSLKKLDALQLLYNQIVGGIEQGKKLDANSRYDKKGRGFNKDKRFSTADIHLSVDSWAGQYGDSRCSQYFIIHDNELFGKALIEVLNKQFDDLMLKVAEEVKEELQKYIKGAEEELEGKLESIRKLKLND